MVCTHVSSELVESVEVFAANTADMRASDIVDTTVLGQVGRLAKLLAANVAGQGLGAGVCSLVHSQGTLLLKGLVAARERAHPRLLASVCSHVLFQRLLSRELCATNLAFNRLEASVDLHVAFKLAALAKGSLPGTALPLAVESSMVLFDFLEMLRLAVLLEFLVATADAAANLAIRSCPAAHVLAVNTSGRGRLLLGCAEIQEVVLAVHRGWGSERRRGGRHRRAHGEVGVGRCRG